MMWLVCIPNVFIFKNSLKPELPLTYHLVKLQISFIFKNSLKSKHWTVMKIANSVASKKENLWAWCCVKIKRWIFNWSCYCSWWLWKEVYMLKLFTSYTMILNLTLIMRCLCINSDTTSLMFVLFDNCQNDELKYWTNWTEIFWAFVSKLEASRSESLSLECQYRYKHMFGTCRFIPWTVKMLKYSD
jgi:hypothetical protein